VLHQAGSQMSARVELWMLNLFSAIQNSTRIIPILFKVRFLHSLRIYMPAYSELTPKPGNRKGCDKKSIGHKNTLGCMAGLTRCRLCGCCRPTSGHIVRGMRGDQQLTKDLIKSRIRRV